MSPRSAIGSTVEHMFVLQSTSNKGRRVHPQRQDSNDALKSKFERKECFAIKIHVVVVQFQNFSCASIPHGG